VEFTDPELIAEIHAGSLVAFERLVRRYERLVYKVALGFTADPQAALDVAQNVFLRIHAKLPSYRGEGELRSWILRLVMNESMNWNRAQKRHRAERLPDELPAVGSAPQEAGLGRREARTLLRRSLDTLSPRHRLAVVLRYVEELPIPEIAATLGCSEGVAKNVLFRSLRKMRTHLSVTTEARP